jgi:hypothetical protein
MPLQFYLTAQVPLRAASQDLKHCWHGMPYHEVNAWMHAMHTGIFKTLSAKCSLQELHQCNKGDDASPSVQQLLQQALHSTHHAL